MASTTKEKSLWEFALALYRSPGVEETVLYLQDQGSANVNVLLWTYWLESRNVELSASLLRQAESKIAVWDREVVQNLRTLRRELKLPAASKVLVRQLRDKVKEAELLAERCCLEMLSEVSGEPGACPQPGQNAALYLASIGIEADVTVINAGLEQLQRDC